MNIQFANQDDEFLTHRLERESFARRHDELNGRLDEILAKLVAAGFKATKEPPDPPPATTVERGWQPLPSLTQAPLGIALGLMDLEPQSLLQYSLHALAQHRESEEEVSQGLRMAAVEGYSFSVASVVEDALQQHENRSRDLDFDACRAEEAAIRRYEAASWLRKVVGIVGARDLPAEPSEEEFRLGLRSGIILCNVLNKIQQGAVLKVVESPCDAALIPDGAALSAYQYFENVRNFLVAAQERGIPTFEASDLEPEENLREL